MSDLGPHAAAAHATAQPSPATRPGGGTPLTTEGRRLLEERIRPLRLDVVELGEGLRDPERRVDVVEGYRRATRELARLESVLAEAETLDGLPDDPLRVGLGDRVSIRSPATWARRWTSPGRAAPMPARFSRRLAAAPQLTEAHEHDESATRRLLLVAASDRCSPNEYPPKP